MRDIFEPRHELAKSIYLAFQTEGSKRKGRTVDAWVQAEREAVFRECLRQAQMRGLHALTMDEAAAAERYAYGSTDYGAKWTYQLVRLMAPTEGQAY
ncbi:hypothetical protein [Massilia soli]|uniref:Transposase n=1 Tax=Massilia soli TaxID=2792854 RepID=A0ABS7SLT1_9BURK|nr:hypothetical protein [Massilia soli]MBZ2207133.1 hypothetical protein [Massilia soli]